MPLKDSPVQVFFVVALAAEANPVVSHFKLSPCKASGFRCYARENIFLVVSGMGNRAAAAAVAYCQGRFARGPGQVWINLGIAGHVDLPLGSLVRAGKITDASSAHSWYPPDIGKTGIQTAELCSVGQAELEYKEAYVYEMEAAGFYESALRFSSAELVQSLKVISDNRQQGVENIDRKEVTQAIAIHLPVIEEITAALAQLASSIAPEPEVEALANKIVSQWHFTSYQSNELNKLLARYHALKGGSGDIWPDLTPKRSSKEVLREIRLLIGQLPYQLTET